jgi:hypothetical protein
MVGGGKQRPWRAYFGEHLQGGMKKDYIYLSLLNSSDLIWYKMKAFPFDPFVYLFFNHTRS